MDTPALPILHSTYGERFVLAVRAYLKENNLRSLSQINANILADLSQRFHDRDCAYHEAKKKQLSESDWLCRLEKDPFTKGIDVRKELGKAQFYCRQKQITITRRWFEQTWLANAPRSVDSSYAGSSSHPSDPTSRKPTYTVDTPVPGWPMILRNYVTTVGDEKYLQMLCARDWGELPVDVRQKIISA